MLEGFDDDGLPIERPPATTITLRNLLTHTSGYAYEFWNADMARYLEVTGTPGIISLEKAALGVPLMFDPGSRWEYGIGIDWAGQMVEHVTGEPLSAYFAEHLTGPLGMDDTAFAPTPSWPNGWRACTPGDRRMVGADDPRTRRTPSSRWGVAASPRRCPTTGASSA